MAEKEPSPFYSPYTPVERIYKQQLYLPGYCHNCKYYSIDKCTLLEQAAYRSSISEALSKDWFCPYYFKTCYGCSR